MHIVANPTLVYHFFILHCISHSCMHSAWPFFVFPNFPVHFSSRSVDYTYILIGWRRSQTERRTSGRETRERDLEVDKRIRKKGKRNGKAERKMESSCHISKVMTIRHVKFKFCAITFSLFLLRLLIFLFVCLSFNLLHENDLMYDK